MQKEKKTAPMSHTLTSALLKFQRENHHYGSTFTIEKCKYRATSKLNIRYYGFIKSYSEISQ
jgi:hypothetical protein